MRTHAQSPKSTATRWPGGTRAKLPDPVRAAVQSPGAPLDDATRAFMEPLLGHDFARVRVHTDDHAADATGAIGARAYTIGHDLVFSPGQYAPGSARDDACSPTNWRTPPSSPLRVGSRGPSLSAT
jgi:hypothetical protein